MDLLSNLALGLSVALEPQHLACVGLGVGLGMLAGVLPGLGAVAAMVVLLPFLLALDVTAALIVLAGVCYGARVGRSTRTILIHGPGEAGAVGEASASVAATDGHPAARRRRGAPVLKVATLASFIAACAGIFVLAALAAPLTRFAFHFGPAEYFSLAVLGLVAALALSSGSLVKAIAMLVLGLLLAQIDTDLASGVARFTLDMPELIDGIHFVAIATGVYVCAGVVAELSRPPLRRELQGGDGGRHAWPALADLRAAAPAVLRGTALGSLLGVLPGGGSLLADHAASTLAKRLGDTDGRAGPPDIRAVAGNESAGSAAVHASFVPALSFGIATSAVTALVIGAMLAEGVQPGPQLMANHPELFWGLIASMWVGNAMLLVLNLPLAGLWAGVLKLPYRVVFPALLLAGCIGLYSLNNNPFDVYMGLLFGVIGFVFHKLGCEPAPLLLGFVMGPMMEDHLRRALLMGNGDWSVFVTRPVSSALLIVAALMVVLVLLPAVQDKRDLAFRATE